MREYWITLYTKHIDKESLQMFLDSVCKKTSKTMTSNNAEIMPYSKNQFIELVLNETGGYFGIHFNKYDGVTFGISKDKEYKINFQYLMFEKSDIKQMLYVLEQAYSLFKPYFGASANDEVGIKLAYKNGKLPKYFEWFWILGPEIAKKYDLTKIPRKFKVKKMKDGGIMILDPRPYDSNITAQDKKQLYNLPKH